MLAMIPIIFVGIGAFIVLSGRYLRGKRDKDIAMFGNMDTMTGVEFENMLAILLRYNGYHVATTPKSGDFGADLIATTADGTKICIQAKRTKSKVGNKSVQEALAGATYYGCNEAWVMTNNLFTPQAIKQANGCGVLLYDRNQILGLQRDVRNYLKSENKTNVKPKKKTQYLEQTDAPHVVPKMKYGIITGADRMRGCHAMPEKYIDEDNVVKIKTPEKPKILKSPPQSIYQVDKTAI